MANETKKEEIREARVATDSTIRELQQTVDALPRTDHMTLPAIQVTEIDPETRARMESMVAINKATDPTEVVNEDGKTLQEVRNEFAFGVSDLSQEGAKHKIEVTEGENGTESVTVVAPVIDVLNAKGEVVESQSKELVIEPTPANIAPIDADAPKNPVEAREAAGLAEDGSEGDPVGGPAPFKPTSAATNEGDKAVLDVKAPNTTPTNLGSQPKFGGGNEAASTPTSGENKG